MTFYSAVKREFQDFVSRGISITQTEPEKVRVRFILSFYPLTILFLCTLIFINLQIHHNLISSITYLLILIGFSSINFYLISSKKIRVVSTLTTIAAFLTASYLLLEGGLTDNGIYWFVLFPIVAYILNSTKEGTIWSFMALFEIGVVWILSKEDLITLLYSESLLIETAIALLFGTVFMAFYNSILESSQKNLVEAKVDLEKYKLAVNSASDHIIITDKDAKILFANPAATKTTGYSANEMIGKTPRLWGGKMNKDFYEKMWKIIDYDSKKPFHGEMVNQRKNGETYDAHVDISPVLDSKNNVLYYVGIERDITKEKEVDRMKTEFVSLASHQLRTPLTSIKWSLEILLDKKAGTLNRNQRQYLGDMYQSNETMISLVNSLLNISRIESGRLKIEPEKIDLTKLFRNVADKLKLQISKAGLTIIDKVGSKPNVVAIDPQLISNVYINLLTNSIKYTPSGGNIEIRIVKDNKSFISSVKDTGCGIPAGEQRHIFERFFRGSNVSKTSIGSTGLGLYLAKEIVGASGGKIWFESKEGKGSTFYFSLPLSGSQAKKGEVSLTN